ncbi:MAG: hypothetical protein MJZ38_00335 [archaeon]|nr:hypothetical protein [archaeon]
MGDRIVIDVTDGRSRTPSFYGHWCGLRAVKVMNDLVREGCDNGIHSLMCNFITEVMQNRRQRYSYYLYNHGETEGAADWDNFTWTMDVRTQTWTTTDPAFSGRTISMDEADQYVKKIRPCLYRECRCEEYGSAGCALRFCELQEEGGS